MRRWHRPLVALGLLAPACSPSPSPAGHRATTGTTRVLHPLIPSDEATTSTEPEPATTTTEAPLAAAVVTIEGIPAPTASGTTTTVFSVPGAETEESDEEWWAGQEGYVAPAPGRAELLACIRSYEQGEDGYATDTGNGFFGAYQADQPTWNGVWRRQGRPGLVGTNPAHASPATQDQFAWLLYQSRGLQPWPTPARRCQ